MGEGLAQVLRSPLVYDRIQVSKEIRQNKQQTIERGNEQWLSLQRSGKAYVHYLRRSTKRTIASSGRLPVRWATEPGGSDSPKLQRRNVTGRLMIQERILNLFFCIFSSNYYPIPSGILSHNPVIFYLDAFDLVPFGLIIFSITMFLLLFLAF